MRRKDLFGIAVLSLRKSDINPATAAAADGAGAGADTVPPTPKNISYAELSALGCGSDGGGGGRISGARLGSGLDVEAIVCKPLGVPLMPVVDLNPLKPCGACKEWLYKIAEVNPGFKVLMFSDISCQEVYIKTVAQC